MCTCTGEPAYAAKALFHLNTSQPDSCASSCESRHVISSSPSQFSAQMGLCARQRKDLLVTERDAKVPQLCVRDSEGFFYFKFPLLVHSCVNTVTYSIVNESRVHTGTWSHLRYLQPFQSLFIECSLLKGSESMLSMLFFFARLQKSCKENLLLSMQFDSETWIASPLLRLQTNNSKCRNKKFECFKFYIAHWKLKIFFKIPKFYSIACVISPRSFAHGHRGAVGCYLTQDGVSDPQYLWCFPPRIQERTASADRRSRELHEWVASEGMTLLSDLVSTEAACMIRCGNSIGCTTIATVLFLSCHFVCITEVIKRFWQCVKLLFPGK